MKCIVFFPTFSLMYRAVRYFKEFEIPQINVGMKFYGGGNVFFYVERVICDGVKNIMLARLEQVELEKGSWDSLAKELEADGWKSCEKHKDELSELSISVRCFMN